MAASIFLTGAFHEDGFADACDGLGGANSSQKALEIMQDSRLGTYGSLGLGLMVTAKVMALAQLPCRAAMILLVVGHCASRASSVLVIATSRYVRLQGKAKPVATGISNLGIGLTLATVSLVLGLGRLALGPIPMACACTGLVLGHLAMRACFERRLGGYTGDCLGAVQQTSELGFYLGALACL
jgi:adenosylcobinamide-GDP ribazoletransferase